jgi:hypothetical protein
MGSLAEFLGGEHSAIPFHHERFDGKGYPNGVARTDIPEGGRLLAVADAYVSLTATDLGGPAVSASVALATISAGAGTKYDPAAVRALLATALRRTGAAVVGGATGVSFLRALSASWASTTAGVAVAAGTAIGLSAVAPAASGQERPPAAVESTTSTSAATTSTRPSSTTPTTKRTTTTNRTTNTPVSKPTSTTKRNQPGTSSTAKPVATTEPPEELATTEEPTSTTSAPPVTFPTPTPQPTSPPATAATTTRPANRAPVAGDDSLVVNANSGGDAAVLNNDGDPEGRLNAGSLRIVSGPSLGSATVQGTSIHYQARGTGGNDNVGYQVCDAEGACAGATLRVTVRPGVDAIDDSVKVPSNQWIAVRLGVLYNDTGDLNPSTLAIVNPPSTGNATVSNGSISFTVPGGMAPGSSTSLRYRICDNSGACDEATATITT